jgi:hypothetical protein
LTDEAMHIFVIAPVAGGAIDKIEAWLKEMFGR